MNNSVKFPDITAKLIGEDGNVYNLMGIVGRALRENGKSEYVDEFYNEIKSCEAYEEALAVMMNWVNVV